MKKQPCLVFLVILLILSIPVECFARSQLYHATRRALAGKIKAHGFSTAKMKPEARFGKGLYFSASPKTALAEKGSSDALLRAKGGQMFSKRTLDVAKPTPDKVRKIIRMPDLRGKLKKGLIGPKLGHRLGQYAGRKDRVLRYRSSKDPRGFNFFVPRKVVEKHPRIIKEVEINTAGRYR